MFGECAIHIVMDDEAAGPFLRLLDSDGNSIAISPDEWGAVDAAARQMLAAAVEIEKREVKA